jgi:hypothetical protein
LFDTFSEFQIFKQETQCNRVLNCAPKREELKGKSYGGKGKRGKGYEKERKEWDGD